MGLLEQSGLAVEMLGQDTQHRDCVQAGVEVAGLRLSAFPVQLRRPLQMRMGQVAPPLPEFTGRPLLGEASCDPAGFRVLVDRERSIEEALRLLPQRLGIPAAAPAPLPVAAAP